MFYNAMLCAESCLKSHLNILCVIFQHLSLVLYHLTNSLVIHTIREFYFELNRHEFLYKVLASNPPLHSPSKDISLWNSRREGSQSCKSPRVPVSAAW